MVQNIKNKKLEDLGWEIIDTNNKKKLNLLRRNVYKVVKKVFNLNEKNENKGLNYFHKHLKNLSDIELNAKKVEVINQISNDKKLVDIIFDAFSEKITSLIGNDLLVQKTINLVIQRPSDKNPTIPHRDAPPNSFFELVIWVPLVDCRDTKSMYAIDLSSTAKNLNQLEKNPENWNKFLNGFKKHKVYPKVKFGQALFFLPYIYHGSDINKTNETRFSLNIRFKSLFTPSGRKFPLHFFRLFKISKISQLALKKTKEEILK